MSRDHGGRGRTTWVRCLAVWLVATTALTLTAPAALAATGRIADSAPDDFVDVLVDAASVALAAALAWLWAITTHTVVDVLRGRVHVRPAGLVRRAVLAACGVAVVLGASTTTAHAAEPAAPSSTVTLDGLPLPERATDAAGSGERAGSGRAAAVDGQSRTTPRGSEGAAATDRTTPPGPTATVAPPVDGHAPPAAPGPSPGRTAAATPAPPSATASDGPVRGAGGSTGADVTVRSGDTLWGIARDRLPEDSREDRIDREWRAIWEANLAAVGEDPDLIHPGQRLVLPDTDTDSTQEQP